MIIKYNGKNYHVSKGKNYWRVSGEVLSIIGFTHMPENAKPIEVVKKHIEGRRIYEQNKRVGTKNK